MRFAPARRSSGKSRAASRRRRYRSALRPDAPSKITMPLMLPGIVTGALMSFITAVNELSSSLILYVGRTMTMPVRIYLSVLDGEFGTAAALSTILVAITGLAVFLVVRMSGQKENAFI